MDRYDTKNLRNFSDFRTFIFPLIEWVPIAALGCSRFTNAEMIEFFQLNQAEKLKEIITNPYELIQYLQNSNFTEIHDHDYAYYQGNKWDIHKSGLHSLSVNQGSCSSLVGIFYVLLQDKFDHMGSLCIMSNSGNGHALNYIHFQDSVYIIDLFVQMNSYSSYIPIETGKKEDFVKTKYITGGCLKTDSLQRFIRYFEKYNKKTNREFLYYTYSADTCPPVSFQKDNDNLRILLPDHCDINIVNERTLDKIIYNFVEMSDCNWK